MHRCLIGALLTPIKLELKEGCEHSVVADAPNRFSAAEEEIVDELTQEELRLGIVKRVHTKWNNLLVLVDKPGAGGVKRKCGAYRRLDMKLKEHNYPIPRIEDMLDKLAGRKVFSGLDLQRGFHQFPLHPDSMEMTAFSTRSGKFAYKFLPFGVKVASEEFQEGMAGSVGDLLWYYIRVYIDDLLAATVTRSAFGCAGRVAREVVQVEHQVAERKVSVHGVVVALVRTDCL